MDADKRVDRLLKCPGSDSRWVRPERHPCANCGYQMEFFSDESKLRCPKCGALQMREATPTCAAWCQSAEQCIGDPERLRMLREALRREAAPENEGEDGA
jgi:predicted RNA-binding Zn-ribbon protein involved in translation (DUF1610 family)